MFKEVKRRAKTAGICFYDEHTHDDLLANEVLVQGELRTPRGNRLDSFYVKDRQGKMQQVWLGCYIVKEPLGAGYYPVDIETAERQYEI